MQPKKLIFEAPATNFVGLLFTPATDVLGVDEGAGAATVMAVAPPAAAAGAAADATGGAFPE